MTIKTLSAIIRSNGRKAVLKTMNINITQKLNLFFKEVLVEMKKVSWLTSKEVVRYTFIVLGVTLAFAIFLGGLDYIFTEIIKKFVF